MIELRGKLERTWGKNMKEMSRVSQLVSWCFEPSRPQRITSGLNVQGTRQMKNLGGNMKERRGSSLFLFVVVVLLSLFLLSFCVCIIRCYLLLFFFRRKKNSLQSHLQWLCFVHDVHPSPLSFSLFMHKHVHACTYRTYHTPHHTTPSKHTTKHTPQRYVDTLHTHT